MPENSFGREQRRRIFRKARMRIPPGADTYGAEEIIQSSILQEQKEPISLASPEEIAGLEKKIEETRMYVFAKGTVPARQGESLTLKEKWGVHHSREISNDFYTLTVGERTRWGEAARLQLIIAEDDRDTAVIIGFDGRIQIRDDRVSFDQGEKKRVSDPSNTMLSRLSTKDLKLIDQSLNEARNELMEDRNI